MEYHRLRGDTRRDSPPHGQRMKRRELLAALLRRRWLGYAAALGAVAVVSLLIGAILSHQAIANVSMLYLIAVLAIATLFGRGPAVLASLAAKACACSSTAGSHEDAIPSGAGKIVL